MTNFVRAVEALTARNASVTNFAWLFRAVRCRDRRMPSELGNHRILREIHEDGYCQKWHKTGHSHRLPKKRLPLTKRKDWWAWVDLNYRPHPYQGCALAT
jgi:hypothetical protein